jgi:NTE family protein
VPDDLPALHERAVQLASRPLPETRPAATGRLQVSARDRAAVPLRHRFGLVLAGGAAKGAYHVGAVECLAQHGLSIAAIAGTSIGALNGVTLAAAPSLREGAARLAGLWTDFTRSMGTPPFGSGTADGETTAQRLGNLGPRAIALLAARLPLEKLVDEAMDAAALRTGAHMRVAVYPVLPPAPLPHMKVAQQTSDWLMGLLGRRSRIMQLNGMSHHDIREAVLASAALPFLFKSRSLAGQFYRDGMLGRDNTPIRALADLDQCDIVIVIHLSPGELVKPVEHPGLTLLQVRPSRPLTPPGPLGTASGLLDFSPTTFQRLREQGFADAERMLDDISEVLRLTEQLRAAEAFMADQVQRVLENGNH